MKIRQHIPSFCVDARNESPLDTDFNNLQELMEIDYIKRWTEYERFHQFSISKYEDPMTGSSVYCLIGELKNQQNEWWVVGYLHGDNVDNLDLPDWVFPSEYSQGGKQ
jgi:hypothetical protein